MATQTDLMVVLEDRPGIGAEIGEALGGAGVNVEGVCGFSSGSLGIVHVLLADHAAEAARAQLRSAGLEVRTEREVCVVDCPDRPGELGRLMRRLADADVNCDLLYLSTSGRLVVGADDTEELRRLLG